MAPSPGTQTTNLSSLGAFAKNTKKNRPKGKEIKLNKTLVGLRNEAALRVNQAGEVAKARYRDLYIDYQEADYALKCFQSDIKIEHGKLKVPEREMDPEVIRELARLEKQAMEKKYRYEMKVETSRIGKDVDKYTVLRNHYERLVCEEAMISSQYVDWEAGTASIPDEGVQYSEIEDRFAKDLADLLPQESEGETEEEPEEPEVPEPKE